jgi:hypothetical protein
MAAYCDYAFYSGSNYLGTAIASSDFPRLALRASAFIDQITYGRAAYEMGTGTTPPDPDLIPGQTVDYQIPTAPDAATQTAIKMAVCAVAEEYQRLDKVSGNQEVASEHVGNNGVTYRSNSTANLSDDGKMKRVAKLYLGATGLMRQEVHNHQERFGYWGW